MLLLSFGIVLVVVGHGAAMWLAVGQSAVGAGMVGQALWRDHRSERWTRG